MRGARSNHSLTEYLFSEILNLEHPVWVKGVRKMLKEKIKKFDIWDIGLIKLSVIAFTLFVLTIWPALTSWAYSVNPWYYFIILVVLAIRPVYKVLSK